MAPKSERKGQSREKERDGRERRRKEGEGSKMRRRERGDKIYPTKAWAEAQGPTSSS